MDEGEYWLLDSVVEAWYPLKWLVSDEVEVSFNRRHHGLSHGELIDTLGRLFARGELLAERRENSALRQRFTPTGAELEEALAGRFDISYGLTPQGGARWEAVSAPDWQRYLRACVFADPAEGEIVGSDRALVEKYDSLSHHAWAISVVAGSRRWDVLKPWQATYWKELPAGHRVRFSFKWTVTPAATEMEAPGVREWFAQINKWYTPYAGQSGRGSSSPTK
jgi:hypothetical protein